MLGETRCWQSAITMRVEERKKERRRGRERRRRGRERESGKPTPSPWLVLSVLLQIDGAVTSRGARCCVSMVTANGPGRFVGVAQGLRDEILLNFPAPFPSNLSLSSSTIPLSLSLLFSFNSSFLTPPPPPSFFFLHHHETTKPKRSASSAGN